MAKIPDGSFRDWHDTETIDATEYKRERELLRVAANDNDERLKTLEESAAAVLLQQTQMSKITADNGAPKISVNTTSGDILAELLALGRGMHTFYAIGGSKNLPYTNISIRGIAHFTSEAIGWVYATDYKNNIFTNYYDTTKWLGWRQLKGSGGTSTSLNTMNVAGDYFVNANTANAPTTHFGMVRVDNTDEGSLYFSQTFIDLQWGDRYERIKYSGVWQAWKKVTYVEDDQEGLWNEGANDGWFMHATQTATPSKKLSQCRNGWILIWSDHDSGVGSNNYDFAYSYIPKGTLWKSGESHSFAIPNYSSSTTTNVTVKKLYVYDNRLVGHTDNDVGTTQTNDVVLRMILEW
jgi:hypothetical protein